MPTVPTVPASSAPATWQPASICPVMCGAGVDAAGDACGTATCFSLSSGPITATAECTAACGGGLRGTTALSLGPLGSLLAANSTAVLCATKDCPSFYWQLEDWSVPLIPQHTLLSCCHSCSASPALPSADLTRLCALIQSQPPPPRSPCSAACGGGTQTRQATCIDSASGAPAEDATRCGSPPSSLSQACNSAPCDYAVWLVGSWSSCQDGITTRMVQCVTR